MARTNLARRILTTIGALHGSVSANELTRRLNYRSETKVTKGAVVTAVFRLRQSIDPNIIVTTNEGYADGIFQATGGKKEGR